MIAANPNCRLAYRDSSLRELPVRRNHRLDDRSPLTAEDLRIHAWLNERLAVLHREQHGLWAKVRWVLLGDRPS
jgi:hypothetical protein